ncbi:MAG TPA: thioredoxin domain-containing protein [Trueperaceae bacterium]|nr:thioredoxin domain-containing protein [Trueperaceae bacterium]
MRALRTAFAALALLATSHAVAGLGDPAADIVAAVASFEPQQSGDGYVAANDFRFVIETRGGVATSVTGTGILTDANVRFLGALLGAASGYGPDIAGPIADFFRTRTADLIGAGELPIQVLEFDLTATVAGPAPGVLSFVFEPQVVDESLFPETSHFIGSATAEYVIRVFSDFQCPFCANYVAAVMPLLEETVLQRDDVRFELHHFPLRSIHPNANVAAEAAECVAQENGPSSFWTYHDALFAQQARWSGLIDPVDTLVALAADLGLATADMGTCLRTGRFGDVVESAYVAASQGLLLTGTPTVFLNGLKVGDYSEVDTYLRLMRLSDALNSVADGQDQVGDDVDTP